MYNFYCVKNKCEKGVKIIVKRLNLKDEDTKFFSTKDRKKVTLFHPRARLFSSK